MKKKTVCMLSCLHDLYDDRIYWKESLSLKKAGYDIIHLGIADKEQDFISEDGIRLISLKRKRYFNNAFIDIIYKHLSFRPSIYKKLLHVARKLNADVYHFHDPQINRIGKQLKSINNTKVIYDIHDPYPQGIKYRHRKKYLLKLLRLLVGNYIEHWQYRKAKDYDLLIATEENVASFYKKALPSKWVEIIYNYSNSKEKISSESKLKEYDAIYCGGISSFRGAWTILNAAKKAQEDKIDLKILLLGSIKEPGLKRAMLGFIRENKLENHITYIPPVPYSQIGDYYSISRCGLVSFENNPVYHILMPIKTFEYMEYGLPIISSNIGHTNQIIKKHNCGLTVMPGSPDEIVSALMRYRNDDKLYNTHSDNGRLAFNENYKWEFMENKLIALYHRLLS